MARDRIGGCRCGLFESFSADEQDDRKYGDGGSGDDERDTPVSVPREAGPHAGDERTRADHALVQPEPASKTTSAGSKHRAWNGSRSANLDANRAWLAFVAMAADLVRWFQLLCCHGPLAKAEPKRMRWTFWHTPASIVRRAGRDIVRIIDGWPTTTDLLDADQHVATLT